MSAHVWTPDDMRLFLELLAATILGYWLGTWNAVSAIRRGSPRASHLAINAFLTSFARAQCKRFGHRFNPSATFENGYLARNCLRGCGHSEPLLDVKTWEKIPTPGPSG